MKDWLTNIKVLWGIIIALGGALTGFIIYNQTLMDRIKHLEHEVEIVNDSYLHNWRIWRHQIEEALIHSNIIRYDAGVLKINGE